MGFEKALVAVKVIKDRIQYRFQSLLNLARGYFIRNVYRAQGSCHQGALFKKPGFLKNLENS